MLKELIALISGILQFLPEVRKLIYLLQKSPAEKKTEITESVGKEADKLKETGRPTWEK
jgi:hypothetical protein